jgi:hypothetical protein
MMNGANTVEARLQAFDHVPTIVGRAVIDDENLNRQRLLRHQRGDRSGQEASVIEIWNNGRKDHSVSTVDGKNIRGEGFRNSRY